MNKIEIPSGVGYFNLDILLTFNTFIVDILNFLYEPMCPSFKANSFEEKYYHLIFFKEGNVILNYNNQDLDINSETFLFSSPNQRHSETIKAENMTKYHIYYSLIPKKNKNYYKASSIYQKEADAIYDLLSQKDILFLTLDHSKTTNNILEKIVYELESKSFGYNYKLNCLFFEVFVNFCRNLKLDNRDYLTQIGSPSLTSISFQIFYHISLYYKIITLKQLAKDFNMSERQIQRYMKNYHNTTFKKRLNDVRIENAKELLHSTNLSVLEIANEVGFKYISYFDEVFREHEKMTPNEFRKNIHRN